MSWWQRLLQSLHWLLHFATASVRRVIGIFWMPDPPAFFRDLQNLVPAARLGGPAKTTPALNPMEIQGTLIGSVMRITVGPEFVNPLLPPGVAFLPMDTSTGLHDVNLVFGYQRNVHPAGLDWLPGCNYMEFVLGIPNLILTEPINGFRGPCAVLTRLELNQLLPVILGRFLGLPKQLTRIKTTEDAFWILSLFLGKKRVEGSFSPFGEIKSPADFTEFHEIISTFQQPGVSQVDGFGLVLSTYDWRWDLGLAQEINATVQIDDDWGGGTYSSNGNHRVNCTGAWRVHTPWTMQSFVKPQAAQTTASGS